VSAGLFGLLDDVAALAKLAAASLDDVGAAAGRASIKAAGVVVDDTAVTPQYVQAVAAHRELSIIRRIAIGSLRNKLLFILPVALLLSQFAHGLLTPILMAGGTYLCFEGAEKVWARINGHGDVSGESTTATDGHLDAAGEDGVVAGAIRTDFILSAEIMVIALNEVADQAFVARAAILAVVAVAITLLVYGVVAVIVKMDDVGLHLAQRRPAPVRALGRSLVRGMPPLLAGIGAAGVAAMLWVGGHILLVGLHDLGWRSPYDLVHRLQHRVEHAVGSLDTALGWLTTTAASAVVGVSVGAIAVAAVHLVGHQTQRDRPRPR
jgi:predicted DNA repair protein MutK